MTNSVQKKQENKESDILSVEDREAERRERIRKIKEEKLERLKNEKYRYYTPNVKVEEWLNLTFSGKYFISLLVAANGIGKSCAGVNTLAHLFFPCGNEFFNFQPLMKKWPFLKKGRIVSDTTTITEAIIPEMKKWFPKGRYRTEKKSKNYEYHWIILDEKGKDTDWEFTLMTYNQDLSEFESANLGWVWFDEPPPNAIYKACVSRLRTGGLMFGTMTPLTGSAWIYDDIISNSNNEEGHRTFVEADVWSACRDIEGTRGHLLKKDIERMIAQYDDDDKQARIMGKFQHLTGLIYKQFSRSVHVIEPFRITKEEFSVYEALDPHPRHPDCVLWVAVDRKGNKFVVDELEIDGETSIVAERIKEKASKYNVIRRICDPWAFNEDSHTKRSLATSLAEHGLTYLPATKTREASNRRIGDAFNYHSVGGQIIRPPELLIFDRCKKLIYELEHYRWQEWAGKTAGERTPKAVAVDKDDHFIEDLGRILIQEPAFMEFKSGSNSVYFPPNFNALS